MKLQRVEIDENLYLLIGESMPIGRLTSLHRPQLDDGTSVRKVSVISVHRFGEVRGYFLATDGLHQALPDYIGYWPEVDDAVERALGVQVLGRARSERQGVLFA